MSKLLLDRLKEALGDAVLETSSFRGDDVALITPAGWRAAARFLRDDPRSACDLFVDLSATDYPDKQDSEGWRFEVYLIVYSTTKKHRIRIKSRVSEDSPELDSLSALYQGCNWGERECYDMFGVKFREHPSLRRILLYDEFEGFPLRKDYDVQKAQPLIKYREGTHDKLGPFLGDEGLPLKRSPDIERGDN